MGWALGFAAAVAAATGAVAVSISDQPDPLRQKPWVLGFASGAGDCLHRAVVFRAVSLPASFLAATAFTGLWTGLISAYGKRALSLSMTGVLAFVFAMGQHFATPAEAAVHLDLTVLGAALYTAYAGLVRLAVRRPGAAAAAGRGDARLRRLSARQGRALQSRRRRRRAAFHALIDAHAALADRLQAARDTLFARRNHPLQLKRIDTLIALLDAFETVLSSDADFELLRRSARREIIWRINALVAAYGREVEGLTLALRCRHGHVTPRAHTAGMRGADRGGARGQSRRAGRSGDRSCLHRHRRQAGAGRRQYRGAGRRAGPRHPAFAAGGGTGSRRLPRADARMAWALLRQFASTRRRCAMPSGWRWR